MPTTSILALPCSDVDDAQSGTLWLRMMRLFSALNSPFSLTYIIHSIQPKFQLKAVLSKYAEPDCWHQWSQYHSGAGLAALVVRHIGPGLKDSREDQCIIEVRGRGWLLGSGLCLSVDPTGCWINTQWVFCGETVWYTVDYQGEWDNSSS